MLGRRRRCGSDETPAVLRAGLRRLSAAEGFENASRSSDRRGLRRNPCRSAASARSRRRPGIRLPSSENLPSAEIVCCVGAMCFLQAATTSSEPRSQHGVVVQTCTRCSPTGCEIEHRVEGRDFQHADVGHARARGDVLDHRLGHPAFLLLAAPQERNHRARLTARRIFRDLASRPTLCSRA